MTGVVVISVDEREHSYGHIIVVQEKFILDRSDFNYHLKMFDNILFLVL